MAANFPIDEKFLIRGNQTKSLEKVLFCTLEFASWGGGGRGSTEWSKVLH